MKQSYYTTPRTLNDCQWNYTNTTEVYKCANSGWLNNFLAAGALLLLSVPSIVFLFFPG